MKALHRKSLSRVPCALCVQALSGRMASEGLNAPIPTSSSHVLRAWGLPQCCAHSCKYGYVE